MKLIANFKGNLKDEEIKDYFQNINQEKMQDVIFCPSNIYLKDFVSKNFNVGSQNVSLVKNTGEITVEQLKSINVDYCIVGHSERRKNFFENDEMVSKKVEELIGENISPILCIGEEKDEKFEYVLKSQIDFVLTKTPSSLISIAYEPVWAIGQSEAANLTVIVKVISFIKEYIKEKYDLNLEVYYGGSVNLDNIESLLNEEILDGLLIGRASLDPVTMNKFVKLNK